MSFDVTPGEASDWDEELENNADRIIEVVTWLPGGKEEKEPAIYDVYGNRVVGRLDQTISGDARNEAQHHVGTFKGTISGNTITGVGKIQMLPYKPFFSGPHGRYERVCSANRTHNTNTILKNDGTPNTEEAGGMAEHWLCPPASASQMTSVLHSHYAAMCRQFCYTIVTPRCNANEKRLTSNGCKSFASLSAGKRI